MSPNPDEFAKSLGGTLSDNPDEAAAALGGAGAQETTFTDAQAPAPDNRGRVLSMLFPFLNNLPASADVLTNPKSDGGPISNFLKDTIGSRGISGVFALPAHVLTTKLAANASTPLAESHQNLAQ